MASWEFVLVLLALVLGWSVYEKGNPDSKLPKGVPLGVSGVCVALLLLPFPVTMAGWIQFGIVVSGIWVGISIGPGNCVGPALHHEPPDVNKLRFFHVGIAAHRWQYAMVALGVVRSMLPLIGSMVAMAAILVVSNIAINVLSVFGLPGTVFATAIQFAVLVGLTSAVPFATLVLISALAAPLAVVLALRWVGGPIRRLNRSDPGHDAEEQRSGRAWRLQDYIFGILLGGSAFLVRTVLA